MRSTTVRTGTFRLVHCCLILAFGSLLWAAPHDASSPSVNDADQVRFRDVRFGTAFSFCSLLAEDNVSRPGSSTSELMMGFNFGAQVGSDSGQPWLIDLEMHFGSTDRSFFGYYNSGMLFSLQAFGGMNFDLGEGILFAHTMVGLNYLHIGASKPYVQQFQNDYYYYGTDGFSNYLADIFNAWNHARQVYVSGFPGQSRLAPALSLGLEIRARENIALTGEYTPLYDERIRHEFRCNFSFIFNLSR